MLFSEPEIILFLLEKGANINHQDNLGKTVAHYVVEDEWDGEEMIEFLHSNGADLTIKDNEGNTPEFYAVTDEIKELINSLN
ncbi:MAG: hypothetical protein U9N62_08845 [Thermotogota bacterium]|nr:hypothetical protein [Thermotogota bacterium]